MRHLHLRKRLSRALEPYPASTRGKRVLDAIIYFIGIVGPLAAIPQLVKIYSMHDASDISLISWSTWALFDIPWIIYGFVHKEPPLLIAYTLWLVFNTLVVVGAILYG
ncbi:MAG: hypothetical protein UY70_C0018G0001 [Candidatus Kaiserbacteria bacterium GW2011_GWB1_52_6]|uniref:MtN3/saliva family n=2 Tax=Candidatus Kaiseribacteriota TaxID=1752734 RepID=A0A0G1XGC4_9BACT|nr:MAG: hypothetical protein UY70_C0018G0001 [Candidatus Kaiserbacteria bacterium GW2011_GWB1_52_6]KKW29970.1 MAG: hypothetical protein UY74_C0058G0005 [Candidatus Kaiserbacteria bacterium GW2011_GWC2_52_8b]